MTPLQRAERGVISAEQDLALQEYDARHDTHVSILLTLGVLLIPSLGSGLGWGINGLEGLVVGLLITLLPDVFAGSYAVLSLREAAASRRKQVIAKQALIAARAEYARAALE